MEQFLWRRAGSSFSPSDNSREEDFLRHHVRSVALVLAIISPAHAGAWGHDGHEIVCELAFQQLTAQGRDLLVQVHDQKGLFYESCVWADEVRNSEYKATYNYHFVNVARDAGGFDFARDCAPFDCVTAAIQRYAAIFARNAISDRDKALRAEALRFLAHFIADVHQPLHVGRAEDRGGNGIKDITWQGATATHNLHSIWDRKILDEGGYREVADARTLLVRIKEMDVTPWQTFDIVGWTDESYGLAERYAYRYGNGRAVRSGDNLRKPYFDRALPIVEAQIMRASVRLAYLINEIADGNLPRNLITLNSPRAPD